MHDLGHMGEGNAVKTRRLHVPRSTVLAAAAYYQHTFADPAFENSIPATFQVRTTAREWLALQHSLTWPFVGSMLAYARLPT